jgi:hypothetical protein
LKDEVSTTLSSERIRVAKKAQERDEKREAKRIAKGRPPRQSVIPADCTAWDAWDGGGMPGVVHYWILRLAAPLSPRAQIWIGGLFISAVVTAIFGTITLLFGIPIATWLLFGASVVCLLSAATVAIAGMMRLRRRPATSVSVARLPSPEAEGPTQQQGT